MFKTLVEVGEHSATAPVQGQESVVRCKKIASQLRILLLSVFMGISLALTADASKTFYLKQSPLLLVPIIWCVSFLTWLVYYMRVLQHTHPTSSQGFFYMLSFWASIPFMFKANLWGLFLISNQLLEGLPYLFIAVFHLYIFFICSIYSDTHLSDLLRIYPCVIAASASIELILCRLANRPAKKNTGKLSLFLTFLFLWMILVLFLFLRALPYPWCKARSTWFIN